MCALIWVFSNERGNAGGILIVLNLTYNVSKCMNVF